MKMFKKIAAPAPAPAAAAAAGLEQLKSVGLEDRVSQVSQPTDPAVSEIVIGSFTTNTHTQISGIGARPA